MWMLFPARSAVGARDVLADVGEERVGCHEGCGAGGEAGGDEAAGGVCVKAPGGHGGEGGGGGVDYGVEAGGVEEVEARGGEEAGEREDLVGLWVQACHLCGWSLMVGWMCGECVQIRCF